MKLIFCLLAVAATMLSGCQFSQDEKHYTKALESFERAEYQKAIDEASLISENDWYCEREDLISLSYLNLGNLDEALIHFKNIQENCEMDENQYINLGDIYFKLERFEEAEVAFQAAFELNPKSELANYDLGVVMYRKEHHQSAVPYLLKAIDYSDTLDLNYYDLIIDCYNVAERYDSSRFYIDEVLNIVAGNKDLSDEYLLTRATVYAEYGDHKNCISAIDSVISGGLSVDNAANAYFHRHLSYYMLGDTIKACQDFKLVMDIKPDCEATTLLNCP